MADPAIPIPAIVDSLDRAGMTLVASARMTNGAFELVEDIRSAGTGPIPHIHFDHDEAFYVLVGRFTFVRDREEIVAGPGGFVYIPRGTRHAYRSLEDDGRVLLIVLPPGLSGFLREQGRRMVEGASVLEAMTELSPTFDAHPVD